MKVMAFKRVQMFALTLGAFLLIVLIYNFKKSKIDHSLDMFKEIPNLKTRNFKIDQDKYLKNSERNSIQKSKIPREKKIYIIGTEDLENKYKANMSPDKEEDEVEYIPPMGKYKQEKQSLDEYPGMIKQNPQTMYPDKTTGITLETQYYNPIKFILTTTKELKIANKVKPVYKNIFYEKDHFIKLNSDIKNVTFERKTFHDASVYDMPRKKTNVLLEEKNRSENKKREKSKKKTLIKDYDVVGGDDDDIEMEEGGEYALIHNLLASRGSYQATKQSNLPISVPKNHYIFTSRSFPEKPEERPSFGNGFVAGVVKSHEVHISGVYTGRSVHSHRASVPSTFCHNLSINAANKIPLFNKVHKLDVSTGIYSEIWKHPNHNLVQRVYAHRTLRNLMVYEIDYKRGYSRYEDTIINVELLKWRESSDFTFSVHDSGDKEVSYKVGRVNGQEHQDTTSPELHVLYDHIPTKLSPSKAYSRTKWTFLTAYGHSAEETKQAYEEGKKLIVGGDDLVKKHIEGWGSLWKRGRVDMTGIQDGSSSVDTASHLAKSIYSSLYYTFTSLPLRFDSSFKGMSESGLQFGNLEYPKGGRVRGNQELFIYPPLLFLHNFLAKTILRSRKETSEGAFMNARNIARPGMTYAFESAFSGVELNENNKRCDLSPYVSASVSHAIRQYYYATGDLNYINKTFSSITSNIAKFLQNRLYPDKEFYNINNQMALDESHGKISNSPFANSLIREALSFPFEVTSRADNISIGHFLETERWLKDAEKIYLPTMQTSLVPAFQGYNFEDRVDEADVIMLTFPLNVNMTNEMKSANIDFYDQMTLPTSSMMTKAIFLINWLTMGRTPKVNTILNSFLSLNNNDFRTWSPATKDNLKLPNHLPTMGAFLQVILNGYLGSRLLKDRLDINPSLPFNISSMHVVGFDYMKHSLNFNIKASTVNIMVTKKNTKSPKLIAHVYKDERRYELSLNKQISLPRTRISIYAYKRL